MLQQNGKDPGTPVAIIERGFRIDHRVTVGPLSTIAETAREVGVRAPAIIVIGNVVNLYDPNAPDLVPVDQL
jgi:uroporphyrin-III C-methyltransferase